VARFRLHDDLVPIAAGINAMREFSTRSRMASLFADGLELHVRLVRVPGLDLDLPGGISRFRRSGPGVEYVSLRIR